MPRAQKNLFSIASREFVRIGKIKKELIGLKLHIIKFEQILTYLEKQRI